MRSAGIHTELQVALTSFQPRLGSQREVIDALSAISALSETAISVI